MVVVLAFANLSAMLCFFLVIVLVPALVLLSVSVCLFVSCCCCCCTLLFLVLYDCCSCYLPNFLFPTFNFVHVFKA